VHNSGLLFSRLATRLRGSAVTILAAALDRRARASVESRTFFHDQDGRPWKDEAAFRKAFNQLRDELAHLADLLYGRA